MCVQSWARLWRGLCVVSALALAACGGGGGGGKAVKDDIAQQEWNPIISLHTTGIVPRKSDVYIRFAMDVAPESADKPLPRDLLKLDPAV